MKLETVGPTNTEQFRLFVANPDLSECEICSICAIAVGAEKWIGARDGSKFSQGCCPGCGRKTYITAIKNFGWSVQ